MDAYVVTPGFEAALRDELGVATSRVLVSGVVACDAVAPRDPVFSRQQLPNAVELAGASVRALAEAAYAAVEGAVDAWPGPFTVHAFAPPSPPESDAPTTLPAARLTHTRAREAARAPRAPQKPQTTSADAILERRAALVAAALLDVLGERRGRARRRHRAADAPGAFDETVLVVQLLALARERFLVSAAAPRALPRGGTDLAPWSGGAPPVADDRAPPSRAYRKLEEAFQWMGAAPRAGQTCVDLGAAPGSWTMMAARRGARVVAVDRAPLAPAVARLPGVSAVAGNAFTYAPPKTVDWMLSDVVCEPARAIALVDEWLADERCRNLVVTVKFKGRDQYGALAATEALFARAAPAFARVKHLAHNKNEVTIMVRRFL